MTSAESPINGLRERTVFELHDLLGLTRERVRAALKIKTPKFELIMSGHDREGNDRARHWYIAQIVLRGGPEACTEMVSVRQHLHRVRLWHRCSWKALSILLDVTVAELDSITTGTEVEIDIYRKVAEGLVSIAGRELRKLASQETEGASLKVKKERRKPSTPEGWSLIVQGRSIRQRRIAGFLGIPFVAEHCGVTEKQLCQVEEGRAPRVLVDRVDQMLSRMLGETHWI